jgi:serine/threonine-protein kinase HipA
MILKATMHLTRNMKECEKQYRSCVFNVLNHNRNNHSKNFSFLMGPNGGWRVSPSYDLTFSSGPSAEQCSMVMDEGKNPGISELLKLAKISIKKFEALKMIDEVKSSVSKWSEFAKEAGVNQTSAKLIGSTIGKIIKKNF